MTDYVLPEGMTAEGAARAIASELTVRNGRSGLIQRTYYDTFDGLLHASGLIGVWEDGWLSLVERAGDRIIARAQVPKPTGPLFAWDLPAHGLGEFLRPLIDVRALLPLTEIRTRERPLDVLDREGKTVVRLRVQEPKSGRSRLRMRVHIAGVRGYDDARSRVTKALATKIGFEPADPLLDEALRCQGQNPGGHPTKIAVALVPTESTVAAAASVLRALLDVIEQNLEGAIADLDTEFLHDLRVAVRRSRAVQREFRSAFPPDELALFRAEFRWLQQVTGEARDLDVYLLDFEQLRALLPEFARADLEPLHTVLRGRRLRARRRMVRALRSPRARDLLRDWRRFLEQLTEASSDDRPEATAPIVPASGRRVAKVYRRMARMGDAIGPLSPSADYHELRKQGKELRYLLELFGAPLYPEEVVRQLVKLLKSLQDVLGRHQDREIQVEALRHLGPDVAAASDGARAVMAMGMLVERLEADQLAARESFAARFAPFASRAQRKVVKDTFE